MISTVGPMPLYKIRTDDNEWKQQAACRGLDPAMFFPGRGGDVITPKQVCQHCPVRVECAEAGIDEPYGIWGGMTRKAAARSGSRTPRNERRYIAI